MALQLAYETRSSGWYSFVCRNNLTQPQAPKLLPLPASCSNASLYVETLLIVVLLLAHTSFGCVERDLVSLAVTLGQGVDALTWVGDTVVGGYEGKIERGLNAGPMSCGTLSLSPHLSFPDYALSGCSATLGKSSTESSCNVSLVALLRESKA